MLCRFVVLMAGSLAIGAAADVRVVEEIAAKVNGDIITRGELDQKKKEIEQALRAEGLTGSRLTDAVREYSSNALRDQIDELLLVQKGKDLNIGVDAEINRRLAQMQVESKISDPDKFHDAIRAQYGVSFEDFRDKMRRSMLAQRVIGQEVTYRVNIPEADQMKYYEEHKTEFVRKEQVFLSQLVVSTEGKSPEQAEAATKKAKDLVARARKGEKFSELVRDNSDDPETAKNGGQMPPMDREMLQPQIAEIVFKEKKGFVTDPIQIPSGWVILKIEERYDAGQASFEEVKNEIQEKLATPKVEPRIREYLTRLREQAFLQIREGYTDSGAAPNKDTRWQDVAQLKPQTTTKEEVAARTKKHKKILFIPIPGTSRKQSPAAAPANNPATTAPAATGTTPPEAAPVKK